MSTACKPVSGLSRWHLSVDRIYKEAHVFGIQVIVPVMQASVKLYHFDQLGPDFLELASQYRDLQEDLEHANFTLQEFQKAAADEL